MQQDKNENNSTQNRQSVVRETVRKKPVNFSKLARRTAMTVVMAILFGAIACLTFLIVEPIINNVVNPERVTRITFPEENVPVEQLLTEESKAQMEEESQKAAIREARQEMQKEIEREVKLSSGDQITAYRQVYDELAEIAKSFQGSLVNVVVSTEFENWLQDSYERQETFSGLVIADNTATYIVLADLEGHQGSRYTIRFQDDSVVEVPILQMDEQTGLAVFAIPKSVLKMDTKAGVSVAKLGSSNDSLIVGKPIIAVGSPQGYSNSVSYGIVTGNGAQLQATDANYGVLLTDVDKNADASGVIIDLDGRVLGVIAKKAQSISGDGGLVAIGISELKDLMAKLSNNESRVYLGVRGIGVTQIVHDQSGVPFGAFVTEVEADSPAMRAGVRNGDIITAVGDSTISSFRELRTVLLTLQPQSEYTVKLLRFNGSEYQQTEVEVLLEEAE